MVYYSHDLSSAAGAAALYNDIKADGHVATSYMPALPGGKRIANNTFPEFREVLAAVSDWRHDLITPVTGGTPGSRSIVLFACGFAAG